jgi:dolichyl-phosphate beta-glucosyltransferase
MFADIINFNRLNFIKLGCYKKVHLVIPCYRESARIEVFLTDMCQEMSALERVVIMVVDDGSGFEEVSRLSAIIDDFRARNSCLLPLKKMPYNSGKGAAVYEGWADSGDADWLAFVDADGACSAKEVARLIGMIDGKTALFASRVKMLGRQVDRLFKRHLLGRVYATMVSELLKVPVYDSQCGLKIVPRAAYERVSSGLQVTGFAFDVELMIALLDAGCQIQEVPIDWHEVIGGKVNLFLDSWRMARDVMRIKARRSLHKKRD